MVAKPAAKTAPPAGRRIVIAAASASSLRAQDKPLVETLVADGHAVLCLAEVVDAADAEMLGRLGAETGSIDLEADRFALMPERQVVSRLARQLTDWGADTVVARGGEVMAYAVLAGQKAGCMRRVAITDERLPRAEEGRRKSPASAERAARAFAAATDILCFNYDDAAALELSGLLPEGGIQPVVLPGYGVDLDRYAPRDLPAIGRGLSFLMVGDLRRSAGVLDYCEAAARVKARAPQTEFRLAGPVSLDGDDALGLAELAKYRDSVGFIGDMADVRDCIAACHVFVAPSLRDASPVHAFPALAMGRPVIASDADGVRELVDERVNGCLCAPGDPASLAKAMESYLKRPDLIPAMARASRKKAERRFDRRLVMAAYFDLLGLERADIGG